MADKFIAVCGPTASGKTAVSIELAKALGGEIISCDSMQIYRGMDIGSAKPTKEEQSEVKHHLIDILDPGTPFSCVEYKAMAEECICSLTKAGKVPVVCGGTGLYLDSLVTSNIFPDVGTDEAFRKEMNGRDPDELIEMLRRVDPESASAIHKNNKKRVIRALEIYKLTGVCKSEFDRRSHAEYDRGRAFVIMLDWDREVLYGRINNRVDEMVKTGLIEEAKAVRPIAGKTASQAIGYKELYDYFDGHCPLDEAVEKIKTSTRNYAKRQLTWFKNREYVIPLKLYEGDNALTAADKIQKMIKESNFKLS